MRSIVDAFRPGRTEAAVVRRGVIEIGIEYRGATVSEWDVSSPACAAHRRAISSPQHILKPHIGRLLWYYNHPVADRVLRPAGHSADQRSYSAFDRLAGYAWSCWLAFGTHESRSGGRLWARCAAGPIITIERDTCNISIAGAPSAAR